jgi:hypothetical protein
MTDDLVFFNPNDRGVKRTRGVWVTLTYDTKRCDFKDALRNVGVGSKRFMAYVSKKFDKVSCCRVFASFENGHPHIRSFLKRWLFVFYRKRFFSVGGLFRQLLHDLINSMHNSNRRFRQVTLFSEVLLNASSTLSDLSLLMSTSKGRDLV